MTRTASAEFRAEPSTARAARRFVTQSLSEWGLEEPAEAAVLLVSELVTNALLHAGTDLVIKLAEGGDSLRVEVLDGSSAAPAIRHYAPDAATGRGLGLVAALSTQWGVTPSDDGKAVWFELPSHESGGDRSAPSAVVGPSAPADHSLVVHLLDLPVPLVWASMQYGDALLREVTLLALDGDPEVGGLERWQVPPLDLEPVLMPVRQAVRDGVVSTKVTAAFPTGAGSSALRRLAVVAEANRLATEGHLLLPAGLPEVNACRSWMLGEILRQEEGGEPRPWVMPPTTTAVEAPVLAAEQQQALDSMAGAVVAADDTNHIVYVSDDAAALLGWEAASLRGERLTVIVPPELRAAHLGGYTRYQVTGEHRLLGQPVRVPALRRDGTIVEIELLIEVLSGHPVRVFAARMQASGS